MTSTDTLLPETQFPDTRAGEQARWLVEHIEAGGEALSEPEVERHIDIQGASSELMLEILLEMAQALSATPLTAVDVASDQRIALVFTRADGRGERVTLEVESEVPQRIISMWTGRQAKAEVVVRRAGREDEEALRSIESRTPRQAGQAETIERAGGLWSALSLMESPAIFIAEAVGEPVGFIAVASTRVIVGGEEHETLYLHRARVLPESQRLGAGSSLIDAALGYAADLGTASMFWYVAFDNDVARAFGGVSSGWSEQLEMIIIRCRDVAKRSSVPVASPEEDANHIVELLNESHSGEEMFLPFSRSSLSDRLERVPDIYGWDRVLLSGDAVIGVRADGPSTWVRTEREGERMAVTRAMAVDYGCRPGSEQQFEQLLRAWCAKLVDDGVNELALLTSEHAHLSALLRGLASRVVPFEFWTSGMHEPDEGAPAGVYVDPLYF